MWPLMQLKLLLQPSTMHMLKVKPKVKSKPHQQLQGGKPNYQPFQPNNMLQWLQSSSNPNKEPR